MRARYIAAAVAMFWVAAGVVNLGLHFAYIVRSYPYNAADSYASDRNLNITMSIMGPIALMSTLTTGQYGKGFLFPGPAAWKEAQQLQNAAREPHK
jgi:hypothetical protein